MKKIVTFTLTLFLLSGFALAGPLGPSAEGAGGGNNQKQKQAKTELSSDLFNLDEAALNEAFSDLDVLEAHVNANEGITLNEVQENSPELLENLNISTDVQGIDQVQGYVSNGLAFLLGCVLGVIGVLIVAIVSEGDWEPIKFALFGMLAWLVLGLLFTFLIFGASCALAGG